MSQLQFSMPGTKKILGQWHTVSASKLIALFECSLAFCFEYFLKYEVKRNPLEVFGAALHYFFSQFFKKNYVSPDSFAGAWTGLWLRIGRGECGPYGFSSDPVEIAFESDEQVRDLLAYGKNITRMFYRDNIHYRNSSLHPRTEVSFWVKFREYTLRVGIDRIQPVNRKKVPDEEVWDYKPWLLKPENFGSDVQLIIYSLAYFLKYNRKPVGTRIYCYKSGKKTEPVDLCEEKYFEQLYQWIREAHAYIFGVVFGTEYGYLPGGFQLDQFKNLRCSDVEQGIFTPNFSPSSNRCIFCPHCQLCEEWRSRRQKPPVKDEILASLTSRKGQSPEEQLEFFVQKVLAGNGRRQ